MGVKKIKEKKGYLVEMLVLTLEASLETLKEKQPKLTNIEQNVISLEKLDKQETIQNMKGHFAL